MNETQFFRRSIGVFALAFLGLALTFLYVHQRAQQQTSAQQTRAALDQARLGFAALEAEDERLLELGVELLERDPGLRRAYLRRDRAGLLALAAPVFERLKAGYGVTHFYFLDPPPAATCFLRVHRPELFGDRIERATYRRAVAGGGFGVGKELGQTAFALRVVHPWAAADGRVIGYLELGEEIGHFLGALKARTGDDYALLLDKRRLDPVLWMHMRHAQGRLSDWSERPVYVLAQDTGVAARDLAWNGDLDALPAQGRILGTEQLGGRDVLSGVFPVWDAGGGRCGAVLMARDVTEQLRISRFEHVVPELCTVAVFLVLAFLLGWLMAHGAGSEAPGPDTWRKAFGHLPPALARAWRKLQR